MPGIRYRTRADGSVAIQVYYRDETGKQRSETMETEKGARELIDLAARIGWAEALEILDEREGAVGIETLRDYASAHVDSLSGVTQGTRDRYRKLIDSFGTLADLPVSAITERRVRAWVNSLEDSGLAGKTIANKHGFLSSVMKAAVDERLVDANPCRGTRLPKTVREEMVFLTHAEFDALLPYVPERARDLVAILPWTGLRFGEVTALRVGDVNFEAGTISITRAYKAAETGIGPIGTPKSNRSRRTVPIASPIVPIFERAAKGKKADALLFPNSTGGPWTRSRFHEGIWQPAVKAANLGKRPTVHGMRHSCAAWLLASGADMYTVQRWLGHESYTTTEKLYAHLEPTTMKRAAAALAVAAALLAQQTGDSAAHGVAQITDGRADA